MKNFIQKPWTSIVRYHKENAKDPGRLQYEEAPASSASSACITCAGLALLTFVLYYKIALAFCSMEGLQDMKAHAEFAQNFYLNPTEFFNAWLRVPHMLWHLVVKFLESRLNFPLYEAAALTFALFGTFSYGVMTLFLHGTLKTYTGQKRLALASLGSACLSFVGPLIMEWFSDGYMGSFSANPMHNPTHMAAKGFGMLAMMAGIDVIRRYRGERPMFFHGKGIYVYFGVFAFFSSLAKPTFIYMLLPAGIIVVLWDLFSALHAKNRNAGAIWGAAWRLALASLPSIAYLLTEYLALFFWGTEKGSSVILTKPFEVWHFFTPNIKLCILLGTCFPLWMLITNLGYFYKSAEGRLAFLGYATGFLEFALLAESGSRKDAGNFAWCLMAGMTVFFLIAVSRLALTSLQERRGKWHQAYVIFSWFLLFLHVYSGLSYYQVFVGML